MLLEGKTAFIAGIANQRSIASAIAQAFHREGARLAISYQNDRLGDAVKKLTEPLEPELYLEMDVTNDDDVGQGFEAIDKLWDGVDIVVHALAYAKREDISGTYVDTSRDGFLLAHNVSAYSLVQLAEAAQPLMKKNGGGSVMAMTYYGSEKVVPGYNVMGVAKASLEASIRYLASDLGEDNIRVNGISAGPVRTLSARAIGGFTEILDKMAERAPLKRNIEVEEVADTGVYLGSNLSRGVTGEVIYVDAGYNIMGM